MIKYLLRLMFDIRQKAEVRSELLPVNRKRVILKLAVERFNEKKLLKF